MGTVDCWVNVGSGPGYGETVVSHTFTVPDTLTSADDRTTTDALRLAAKLTLDWFNREYIPLRFTNYAKNELGYNVAAGTWRKKRTRARDNNPDAMLPNVFTGETRKNLQTSAYTQPKAVGGATSKLVQAKLILPKVPRGRNLVTNRTLNMVTAREGQRIAKMFEEFLRAIVNSMTVTTFKTRKGEIKTRATMAQADQIQVLRSMRGRGRASIVEFNPGGAAATGA